MPSALFTAPVALLAALLLWTGAATAELRYRIHSQTTVAMDRYRGLTDDVDRLDAYQRLHLTAFEPYDPTAALRLSAALDLEVGSDFGPEPEQRLAVDGRLVRLDLRRAHFKATWRRVDLTLGRDLFVDATGAGALDGGQIALRLPHVRASARFGLATRPLYSGLGPDLYTPDGLRAPDRLGYVAGAGLATRSLHNVRVAADWRRSFDASGTQAEAVGAVANYAITRSISARSAAVWDIMTDRFSELRLGAGAGPTWLRADVEAAQIRPRFSHDSIWHVFGDTGHERYAADLASQLGRWRLAAGGDLLRFPGHQATNQRPGDVLTQQTLTPERVDISSAWAQSAHLSVARSTFEGRGRVGAEARHGDGYGGRRQLVDVFASGPFQWGTRSDPMTLGARIGAVRTDEGDRRSVSGLGGWAALTVRWELTKIGHLGLVGEGHAGPLQPWRTRMMGTFALEDWW